MDAASRTSSLPPALTLVAHRANIRFSDGWWPYVLPYFAFLLVVELSAYFPAGLALPTLVLKPLVPAVLLLWFFRRGAYAELGGGAFRPVRAAADIGAGIASACLWVGPYLFVPELKPDARPGFDPEAAGLEFVALFVALRFAGFALVTPVFEELFIRSFVMRYAAAMKDELDFREVPVGRYSLPGFLASVIVFTVTHVPWEYWVAVPWIVLTNLYFYWRRSLWGMILLHGTANASILLFVLFAETFLPTLPSLWFFV